MRAARDHHGSVVSGGAGRAAGRLGPGGRDRAALRHPGPARWRPRRSWRRRAAARTASRSVPTASCYVCNNGGFEFTYDEGYGIRPARAGLGLLGRPDRADRPCERRGRGAVPRHLAHAAARAERHRVRRPRRLLLHRPRQGARSRLGPRRGVLRQGRRLADQRGRLPAWSCRTASACRPTATPSTSPRPRRRAFGHGRSSSPACWARSPGRARTAAAWSPTPAAPTSGSIRSPSRRTATSASRP